MLDACFKGFGYPVPKERKEEMTEEWMTWPDLTSIPCEIVGTIMWC
jgi:hypothetical protein